MNTRMEFHEGQQRLAQDVRAVVNDAEALLRVAKQEAGEGYAEARNRLEQSLENAKSAVVRMERAAVDRARAAGRATDDYVHDRPWQAMAAAAAVGALLGMLLSRR